MRIIENPPQAVLTPRMLHILELMGESARLVDVARAMGVSKSTVSAQLNLIYTALGADNARQAVTMAITRGLIRGSQYNSPYGHHGAAEMLVIEADRVQREGVHKPLPVDHPERCLNNLVEEIGEVAGEIQKRDPQRLQHELIQAGGIIVQWLARLAEIEDENNNRQTRLKFDDREDITEL